MPDNGKIIVPIGHSVDGRSAESRAANPTEREKREAALARIRAARARMQARQAAVATQPSTLAQQGGGPGNRARPFLDPHPVEGYPAQMINPYSPRAAQLARESTAPPAWEPQPQVLATPQATRQAPPTPLSIGAGKVGRYVGDIAAGVPGQLARNFSPVLKGMELVGRIPEPAFELGWQAIGKPSPLDTEGASLREKFEARPTAEQILPWTAFGGPLAAEKLLMPAETATARAAAGQTARQVAGKTLMAAGKPKAALRVEFGQRAARGMAGGAAKEPWQMTADEYVNQAKERLKTIRVQKGLPYGGREDLSDIIGPAVRAHKSEVEQALSEGKPVPPEVLADYPDLSRAAEVTRGQAELPVAAAKPAVQPPVGKLAETAAQPGPVTAPLIPEPVLPPPPQAAASKGITLQEVLAGIRSEKPSGAAVAAPAKPMESFAARLRRERLAREAAGGGVPPADPLLPRPRTLNDMNREAKGMRAMTPEQRAAIMDVAKPIEGNIFYQARPFNEHAQNLLGPDTGFMKALRAVPGIKQGFGAWNPAAMARDNPVAMIGLRQSIFQEIEKSRVRFATLRWWNDADEAFGFKRSGTVFGLRPARGVWKATKVKPASGAVQRDKMFGTFNDMVEHPERYTFTENQTKALILADNTLTQSVRDAQRAGVNVVELAEAYWPRIVTRGPKGKVGFGGIRKRVSSAKGYTRQRKGAFADIDDLVGAGYEVETDPRRVFAARLEAGIDTIAQANARKQIAALPGAEKPLERMTRRFPEVLQTAQEARVARDAAKATVVRAGAKATPTEVLTLRQAEADYITAMREVFTKKLEVGTPGYYELRLPNGRIAPQELVEQVGKFIDLPELRQAGVGMTAEVIREVSQLLRTTLTNVDLAAGFIQGQSLFYRNNVAWWKSQGLSITALIDDPTAWVAKNFDLIDEGVRMGAIVAPTEFLFAKQGLASIPLRVPYAGPALGSFNRAFEWFITAGQTELYKAARSGVAKNAGIDELVSLGSAIRKEVGTESYAILGIRPNQRTMEALTLFAARFFRATVGVLGQSFTRGPGGAEARKAVGGLVVGGTALLIGIKWAQDRELPNMTDPYAEDWMQFKLGDTYFNTFGPMYPYFRTTARMSVSLADGDAVKAGTELRRFLSSKESLPLRAIDITGQLIYYGTAYVYGTKIEKTWASIAKGILSEFVTPISAQEIPSGFAEGRPESVLGAIGLTGRPEHPKPRSTRPFTPVPVRPRAPIRPRAFPPRIPVPAGAR